MYPFFRGLVVLFAGKYSSYSVVNMALHVVLPMNVDYSWLLCRLGPRQ